MKKFYSWSLALIAVLCCSLNVSAFTITLKWNEANTVKLYKGSYAPANEIDVTGLTETTIESESSFYLYVLPADGYLFESITEFTGNVKTSFSSNANYGGQFYSSFVGSSRDGKELTINTKPLARNSSMTVNVVNGAENIGGYVTGLNVPLDWHDGENTLKFNPELETGLYIQCVGVSSFYQIKLNGTDVAKNQYYARYEINNIKDGDELTIQVYEGGNVAVPVSVTLQYADGLDGCLNNIRNWSLSQFVTPTDNKIEVVKGQDVAFNFFSKNNGFNITGFEVNGEPVSAGNAYKINITDDNAQIRFNIEGDITLKVNGSAATYAEIPMTAYVMNPEGVIIKAGTYADGTPVEMNGTAITENITLPTQTHTDSEGNVTYITPSFTLTPENAQKIGFTVQDRKYYNAYIAPKAGWYIATVQDNDKAEVGYIDKAECQTFYVVAQPLPNDQTATINVDLSNELFSNLAFKSNTTLESSWDNPAAGYTLTNGSNTIKYTKGYQTPFTVASKIASTLLYCEIDQRALPLADAETAVSYQLDLVNNSVVNVSGTDYMAQSSVVSLTQNDGKTATYTYGPLKREGATGYNLLNGTEVSVKPNTEDCMLAVNGTVIYSPLNGINDLTDGAYTFHITAATSITVSADSKAFEITRFKPLNGQAIAEFETFTITLPALEDEHMFVPDLTALGKVTVTPESGSAITASNVETMMNQDGSYDYHISFEVIDEPGKYTVSIPAGFFCEAAYNESAEAYEAVGGGQTTAALTSAFVIDPNAPAYHLVPTAGSDVNDLSAFEIVFLDAYMVEENEGAEITLTGTGYSQTAGQISQITGRDYLTYQILFANPPVNAGEYTLTIPAGSFSIDGWKESEAVTAKYNYTPMWALNPAPGSVIEETTFTLTFPSAADAEFVGSKFDLSLTQGETYATPGLDVVKVESATVPTFTISVNPEAQKAPFGALTLTIDEGAFMVDGQTSPFISADYTYEGSASADYQCDPQGDKILIPSESWGMVMWTFIFDEATTVQGADASQATVTLNGTRCACIVQPESNMLMMALGDKSSCKDGDVLRVQIPAGAFTLSGQPSPAIDRSWTLVEAKTYTWTANPANNQTIAAINTVTITFEGAESVEVNESSPYVDVKQSYNVAGKMLLTGEGGSLVLTALTPVTSAGTYTVQISPYQFTIDEVQTIDNWLNLTYTVDPTLGVTDVTVEEVKTVTVVSIDGRVLLENADPARLKTLAPGIYIVNGKKYLVK